MLTNIPTNRNAMHLLETVAQVPNKIFWSDLSTNPNIFEIDMKQYKIDIIDKANILDTLI